MIPKILHVTWKTEELPRVMARYLAGWRRLHPGWEVRLWTDATMHRFVADTYPDLLAVYDGYPKMIQRADSFRYLVLNHFGGVYADLDVEALHPIDELLALPAFVGIEPYEHIASDRVHAGLPFLFTNAFMGAEPGHPLFRLVVELLPQLASQEVFFATGPSMLTAALLRLAPEDRPTLLLPRVWSPLRDGGRPTRGDARLRDLVAGIAPLYDSPAGTLVSHKWMTTWVKWHERYSPLLEIAQLPSRGKWWLRRGVLHRELGAVRIPDPVQLNTEQRPMPGTGTEPIFIGIRLDGSAPLDPALGAAISGLDYPADRLRLGVDSGAPPGAAQAAVRQSVAAAFGARAVDIHFEPAAPDADPIAARAAANNRLLARVGADRALLLVGGEVRQIPPDALLRVSGMPRPVVAANVGDAAGHPDISVFLYNWGPDFRILYKLDGLTGRVRRDPAYRYVADQQQAFAVMAVDGVGDQFVLIDAAVGAAGVRFAEDSYKLHRNGEAFGIMARDLGFESVVLTGLRVTTG